MVVVAGDFFFFPDDARGGPPQIAVYDVKKRLDRVVGGGGRGDKVKTRDMEKNQTAAYALRRLSRWPCDSHTWKPNADGPGWVSGEGGRRRPRDGRIKNGRDSGGNRDEIHRHPAAQEVNDDGRWSVVFPSTGHPSPTPPAVTVEGHATNGVGGQRLQRANVLARRRRRGERRVVAAAE